MAMTEALSAGLQLMLIGMGVVFLLLGLLVFTIQGVSRLVRLAEQGGAEPPAPVAPDGAELAAAIGAAVHRYRHRHPRP